MTKQDDRLLSSRNIKGMAQWVGDATLVLSGAVADGSEGCPDIPIYPAPSGSCTCHSQRRECSASSQAGLGFVTGKPPAGKSQASQPKYERAQENSCAGY